MTRIRDEESFLTDEIVESEEAFLVLAMLFTAPRTPAELAGGTGLDREIVGDLLAVLEDMGVVGRTRSRPARHSLRWKAFTRLFIDAAVGMDTEISIMVEAFEESGEESFEEFASKAEKRVARFEADLARSAEFGSLLRDYLKLLVGEILADDPGLYGMTLLDAAVAFESLLAKVGPDALRTRSKAFPGLLAMMRDWASYAGGVNMLAEVALAETLAARGLLKS